jgi:hypothetical protein
MEFSLSCMTGALPSGKLWRPLSRRQPGKLRRKQPEIAKKAKNAVGKKGIPGEIPQEVSFMPIQKIVRRTSLHAVGVVFESVGNSGECHSISKTLHFHPRRWTNSRYSIETTQKFRTHWQSVLRYPAWPSRTLNGRDFGNSSRRSIVLSLARQECELTTQSETPFYSFWSLQIISGFGPVLEAELW